MADVYTTTTQVDPVVANYYDRALLMVADDELIHTQGALMKVLPKNSGNTFKFRRPGKLAAATTPLTEAVTPDADQLSKTDLSATPKWYGAWVFISDEVEFTNEEPVLNWAAERLNEQRNLTIDTITRDVLAATSSATDASNGSNGETVTEINKTDLDIVYRTLRGANAKFLSNKLAAGTGQGTAPIRAGYLCFGHVDVVDDVRSISGFRGYEEYGSGGPMFRGEEGAACGFRICLSSNGKVDTSENPDEYIFMMIGKEAFGMVDYTVGNEKSIFKPRGHGEDRLNQRSSLGWKQIFVAKILNDSYMHRLNCTRSDSINT